MTRAINFAVNANGKIIISNSEEVYCSHPDCRKHIIYNSPCFVCSLGKEIFCTRCKEKPCFNSLRSHEDILGILKREVLN